MNGFGSFLRTTQKAVDVVAEVSAFMLALGVLFQMEKNNSSQR